VEFPLEPGLMLETPRRAQSNTKRKQNTVSINILIAESIESATGLDFGTENGSLFIC
jgi:hypothetical protein